jgi:hypothetical protein
MRALELFQAIVVAVICFFAIKISVKQHWPQATRVILTFVVPCLVFAGFSLYYVIAGENINDTIAKRIWCPFYSFEACPKQTLVLKSAEADEEAERRRLAEAEAAARKKVAEEQAERLRIAEETARKSTAELQQIAEIGAARKKAAEDEAERHRRLAEAEEARKKAAEDLAERQRLAEEAARKQAEGRLAEAEAARKKAVEELAESRRITEEAARKKVAEEEAERRRRLVEAEATRKKAAEELAERQRIAEEAARKKVAEELAEGRRIAEEAARKKAAEEEAGRRRRVAEAEAVRKKAEQQASAQRAQVEANRAGELDDIAAACGACSESARKNRNNRYLLVIPLEPIGSTTPNSPRQNPYLKVRDAIGLLNDNEVQSGISDGHLQIARVRYEFDFQNVSEDRYDAFETIQGIGIFAGARTKGSSGNYKIGFKFEDEDDVTWLEEEFGAIKRGECDIFYVAFYLDSDENTN